MSVVTPSYNQGAFIRETIESVLNQNYPNIEYWVIDGGSTDQTVAILREYESDPRFHWLSEPDKGQTDAINKGWGRCYGDIFCWLNSDDYYVTDGAITLQVEALSASPSHGIVYGDCVYVDQKGNKLSMYPAREFSATYLLRACYLPQPSVFLQRDVLLTIGPLDTRFGFAMDYDYWLRCSTITNLRYNKRPIATYRLHDSSKTMTGALRFGLDIFEAKLNHLSGIGAKQYTKRQRRSALADAVLGLAVTAGKSGQVAFTAQLVKEGAKISLWQYRYLHILFALVDHYTGIRFEFWMAELFYLFQNPLVKLRSAVANWRGRATQRTA